MTSRGYDHVLRALENRTLYRKKWGLQCNTLFFLSWFWNLNCGCSLEMTWLGSSNEHPESISGAKICEILSLSLHVGSAKYKDQFTSARMKMPMWNNYWPITEIASVCRWSSPSGVIVFCCNVHLIIMPLYSLIIVSVSVDSWAKLHVLTG